MFDVPCRVHVLPNAVGKGRLMIFLDACKKFSLPCFARYDIDTVDCVIVEDTLDTHVVIEKILQLDPTSAHLPELVSTRWLSESLRAQQLLPRTSFVRTVAYQSMTTTTISNDTISTIDRSCSQTKFHQEPTTMPRLRSNSDSDYEENDNETNKNSDEPFVRIIRSHRV
jgi:hypothetical protein